MIVLDASVVSEMMRPRPDPGALAWIDDQPEGEVCVTALTTAESRYGIARLPEGRRKAELTGRRRRAVEGAFAERILPFGYESGSRRLDACGPSGWASRGVQDGVPRRGSTAASIPLTRRRLYPPGPGGSVTRAPLIGAGLA